MGLSNRTPNGAAAEPLARQICIASPRTPFLANYTSQALWEYQQSGTQNDLASKGLIRFMVLIDAYEFSRKLRAGRDQTAVGAFDGADVRRGHAFNRLSGAR